MWTIIQRKTLSLCIPIDLLTFVYSCRNAEESSSNEWNYGSLMRGLGVDPPLLGWDAYAEDWIDFS